MDDLLMEPLRYYNERGRATHHDNANAYFNELLAKSGVDAEENRATVRRYKEQMAVVEDLDKKIFRYKAFRVLSIVLIVLGFMFLFNLGQYWYLIFLAIPAIAGGFYLIFKKINPVLKDANALREAEQAKADEIRAEAERQMAPLNALFDDSDTFRLIEKTIPEFSFHKRFTVEQEREMRDKYDFEDIIDEESTVVNTVSGHYMGNPFLFLRYIEHQMGTETYHGSLVISWVEYHRDSEGNLVSERKTQTLYASVVKDKPYYFMRTRLNFGHQGAPDLSFSRESKHIERKSEKAIARKVKSGEKKIQKMTRQAIKEGGSFTEMTNSEFDVLFDALDRDHEVQFRMMYTPLAQTNTVALLKSREGGYGDDFDMMKLGKWNIICSDHAQDWDMNTFASNYVSYDIDEARSNFLNFNNNYFRSVFFDFAPLLSVPLYQREPVHSMEDPVEYQTNYAYYEHEVVANSMDSEFLVHEDTVTEAILKTRAVKAEGGDCVEVTAYSYAGVDRVDYVPVLGGDGKYHNVPVPWIEYIPLEKTSVLAVNALDLSERELKDKLLDSKSFNAALSNYNVGYTYAHGMWGYILNEDESAEEVNDDFSRIKKQYLKD